MTTSPVTNLENTVAEASAPEYFNDPIMQRVVRLVAYMKDDRSDQPSVATGFIMERDGERYLISNYHVFKGQSPERRFLGYHPKVPAVIELWNFGVPVADIYVGTDYLVHPDLRDSLCDIAAYPLSKVRDPEKGEVFGPSRLFNRRVNSLRFIDSMDAPYQLENDVEMHRFVGDAFVPVSRDATVFGYPGGIEFDFHPVGVNTKIASSFYNPKLPYFLVSGTTYKGCSGAPVVARSIGGYLALKLARPEEFRRGWPSSYKICHEAATVPVVDQLIGIYSGRLRNLAEMNEKEDREGAGFVGQVWHWRLVQELLEKGVPDSAIGY